MRKKSPPSAQLGLLRFLLLILALASLLGVLGCGGGSSGSSFTGGGGGGGGGNVLPCTFNPPASGGSTSGAGVGTLIANDYFGMHLNSEDAPWPFFSLNGSTQTLPFGSQRLWDAGIAWSQVNTSSGVYDWTTAPQDADTWMSDAQAHAPLNELYTLARTPMWASSDPGDTSCIDSAENGGGQCHPPIDLNTDGSGTNDIWIAWVTAAAQYSKSKKDAGEPAFRTTRYGTNGILRCRGSERRSSWFAWNRMHVASLRAHQAANRAIPKAFSPAVRQSIPRRRLSARHRSERIPC